MQGPGAFNRSGTLIMRLFRHDSWPALVIGLFGLVCLATAGLGALFSAPDVVPRTGFIGFGLALMMAGVLVRSDPAHYAPLRWLSRTISIGLAMAFAAAFTLQWPFDPWTVSVGAFVAWYVGAIAAGMVVILLIALLTSFPTRFMVFPLAGLVLVSTGAAPASAASCMSREIAVDLVGLLDQVPVWRGLTEGGNIEELWSNASTGTWTYLGTSPEGTSCIVSSGTPGELLEPVAMPEGEAS